ncbi:MAG: helix-turn-helix domain-containing protein [Arthrobacter sp.]|uniref:AraC-like ligand-binding domain-containing protein n=1 Tax=Arthrobacter sp. TaxID=1667 RepID=UPI00347F2079
MEQVKRAASFDEWRRIVSKSFVPLEADPAGRGPFAGRLSGRRLNELAIIEVGASAHAVRRTPELIAASEHAYYKLNLQVSGHGLLVQDGRETLLAPGDLAIYDTQRPYTLSFDGDFTTLVMMFPQQLVGLPREDIADLTAVRMGSGHRLGRAVAPFLTQVGAMLPELDGPIGHRLAMNVVDLLATLLADEAYSRPGRAEAGQSRLLRRVQHFIDGQLSNPCLAPAEIAAAHYISTRSLQKLFADSGSTVAGWIRERRLERCRRDLLDPLNAELPVGAIGARWGLPDAAHFSRVFRAAYGAAPTTYRRAAAESGPPGFAAVPA